MWQKCEKCDNVVGDQGSDCAQQAGEDNAITAGNKN